MAGEVALGIDLGSSGVRVVAVTVDGTVVGQASRPYRTRSRFPGWSEQEPADWIAATTVAVRTVAARLKGYRVAGIGLAGQMNGVVLTDPEGAVLRPALLWNDRRGEESIVSMLERVPDDAFVARTGNRLSTVLSAAKLYWLARREPQLLACARTAFLPKDYLGFVLSGARRPYAERTDASGTNLFRLEGDGWDEDIVRALGLPVHLLPEIVSSTAQVGTLPSSLARELGLVEGTPVVAGAGDNCASAVALDISTAGPGRAGLSVGTSGTLFTASKKPDREVAESLFTYAHPLGGYLLLASSLAAGGAITWFRDVLGPETTYAEIEALARRSPPGAAGVTFLPHLSGHHLGEGGASGGWHGLSLATSQADLARSVIEGVAFSLLVLVDLLRRHQAIDTVVVTGMASRLPLLHEVFARTAPVRAVRSATPFGAAVGAALLAFLGLGHSLDSLPVVGGPAEEPEPQPPGSHRKAWERYLELRAASGMG